MTYKDRKYSRKSRSGSREIVSIISGEDIISREKIRARELRQSSWWRKKTSQGLCHYCGKIFKPSELTMDHKIPLARGGVSDKNNLVPACKECNNKKKYLLPMEWKEYIEAIKNA